MKEPVCQQSFSTRKSGFIKLCMTGTDLQDKLGNRGTSVVEEEDELRVHLQNEACRLLSMDDSHEESSQCHLRSLKDLKEQVAIRRRELGSATASEKLAQNC